MNIQEKIDLYIKGKLPEEEIDGLWVEIAKDPELLEQLELEATVKAAVVEKFAQKAPVRKLQKWVWHASAAAAVLLVALIQIIKVDNPTELSDFLSQDINYDQIESSDIFRSNSVLNQLDSLLTAGAQLVREEQLAEAETIFISFSPETDSLSYAKAQFNLGVINYIKEDFPTAEINFKEAVTYSKDTGQVCEKSYWFLSNTQIQQEKLEQARSSLLKAYEFDGVYKDEIYLLLRKLDYDLGYQKPDSIVD